jgi:hypothetical protein
MTLLKPIPIPIQILYRYDFISVDTKTSPIPIVCINIGYIGLADYRSNATLHPVDSSTSSDVSLVTVWVTSPTISNPPTVASTKAVKD